MKHVVVIFLILFCGQTFASDSQAKSVQDWLKAHGSYRLAVLEDCNCLKTINRMGLKFKEDYNPYALSGDFDGDGVNDVAQMVVNRENSKDFLILVFLSKINNGSVPLVYENMYGNDLSGLGFFKTRNKNGKEILLFGAFGSEAEPIYLPVQIPILKN